MPSFTHGDVDLYYEIRGHGKPVLLVAGLASDNAFWLPVVDALAANRQVIVIDNRGSGRTAPLDVATSIDAMADDCAALVRHLRLTSVDLVGHSMGGMIAQECAVRHAELFDRVVLAATGPVNSPRNNDLFASWVTLFATIERALWFRNLYYWVLSAAFFDKKTMVDALATKYPYQQSTAALAGQVRTIAEFDATGHLSTIRARTLVLAGTADLLFPVAASAGFAKAIPHASFAAIEGAAHSFPIEMPQEFTRRVLEFLQESSPR
jgi:pimeloyl-ACP methyl ester carboxylesterase